MLYAGIDVHRKTSYVSVINEKRHRVAQRNLASDLEVIAVFLGGLPEPPKVVMESTFAWCWLYDGLCQRGYEVVVSDPRKTKAIASARLGHIGKQGSAWLRSALVESAQVVAKLKGGGLNLYFRKRITKAGYKKAIVATAHRLLEFAFYVLGDQRPYQEQLAIAA